ncbi:MAG TPA: methyl-accepting chemotaxis protein, partial [Spirochaetota bacterium]|nr:methyl-accepting chemotaxis protein [Spirochaetota bacterium]
IEEISATLEESSSAIKHISDNAKASLEKLLEGSKKAEEGFVLIDKIIKSIQKISEQSNNIRNSLDLIFGITEQTNLLALNASIEAAKAGDTGKGFSVVAQEIRKLADKSKLTANEIKSKIEDNNLIVEEAKKLILNSQNTFKLILETTVSGRQIISEISHAINEQSTGSNEMMSSIDNIYESSQKMVEIVEMNKNNNKDIEDIYKSLTEIVDKFKIEEKKKKNIF